MQVLLVWKALIRHCYSVNLGFRHALIRTHGDNMDTQNREGMTDICAPTHSNGRGKTWRSRVWLLSRCQYLMVTEQDVLWGVKRRVCPNKSQTGHLWEMNKTRNAEACEAGEMTTEGKLSAGCQSDKFRLWSAAAPYDRTSVSVFTSSTILWNSVRHMIWSNLIWD